ncbi:MAG: hypothetical protein JXA44_11895 [Methanospirillaceae archaeon]|nr:hypothetical protein [Methanospirillaceae archaeon]
MTVYLFSEGKTDKIFLPTILEQLRHDYCPLKINDTKSLLKTDRDYYQKHHFIVFADNGRSDIYTKVIRRFALSFFKRESIHPIQVILFLDDDYSPHEELNQTLLNHIKDFSNLIPQMETLLNGSENEISLKIPSDNPPRISIKIFYFPKSLEWQIVQGGLSYLQDQKLSEEISGKDPHTGLKLLSLALSCSMEETIIKSVQENWLKKYQWYLDLFQLLEKSPLF